AGEAEMTAGTVLPRMRTVGHILRHLTQIAIENDSAVQFDLDGRSLDRHFLIIPFTDRPLIAALSGHHAVGRTVSLARIDPLVGVVEDLQFTHTDVGRVAFAGVANG